MLPRVKIFFENGAIGSVVPSDDGVIGVIVKGKAVIEEGVTIFEEGKPYLLTKLDDIALLGITNAEDDDNLQVYKFVKEFYSEAPEGTKLWLMMLDGVSMVDIVDPANAQYAKKLLLAANGTINCLVIHDYYTDTAGTIVDGVDEKVYLSLLNAQLLCEWATSVKYAPVFCLLPGIGYIGDSTLLLDLHEMTYNRVGVVIGDSDDDILTLGEPGSLINHMKSAALGLLAGRIASIPVQRSIARVKSGPIKTQQMYILNDQPDILHDLGYIVPRTFVGKAGYFWSDDKLATATSDDYALIPRRRVIDKAYRIAYQTLVEELGDEIPVTDNGSIPAPMVKHIQNKVETAIENNMTAFGNLGNDPSNLKDTGVECYIDANQNVVSTSHLEVKLRVKPYGYPKYIDVYLGFKTATV